MAHGAVPQGPGDGEPAIQVGLPFAGLCRVENSPARRGPSHGTELWGGRYVIDFVGVDERHRTAAFRDWRTFLTTEPPERFFAFGRPVLAPGDGTVVAVHGDEPDHVGRRSQLALAPYALGQAGRLRRGVEAIAGNFVVIALSGSRGFVALTHFRSGSPRVSVGEDVEEGQHLADTGNSGNSTQPHVPPRRWMSTDGHEPRLGRTGAPGLWRWGTHWWRACGHPGPGRSTRHRLSR